MPPPLGLTPAPPVRVLAQQALSRSAGAPLVAGNAVELLIDARANFDAWLEAIRSARSSLFLENYIFSDDEVSRAIRDALVERAAAGVRVYVVRDWLGCLTESRARFWDPLRAVGGEVRAYNPFHFASPFGWLPRDHRKLLLVDAAVGFVSGVCVSAKWLGDASRGVAPWRDTGVAVRGPAVHDLIVAFADNWARLGEPLADDLPALHQRPARAGSVDLRVVATLPRTAGLYRLDLLIASLAHTSLWLTDAYFVGFAPYIQALSAAARDGVDVRLLVPGTSDLPLISSLSRAGYRPLLEAGVRVFEWNGSMLHAKTAVADGRWARVGSSNLNLASWMDNCELDVAVEDESFAGQMAAQYEKDLENATEIVLQARRARPLPSAAPVGRRAGGSGRAAAGALRLANTVGAAIADHRVLEPTEGSVLLGAAVGLIGLVVVAVLWPRVVAWPLGLVAAWFALSLVAKFVAVVRSRDRGSPAPTDEVKEPSRS